MSHAKGTLITLEGIDGCGKTTLAHELARALKDYKRPVILTKEPGGSLLGKALRNLVQTQHLPMCSRAEFLLFASDRAQHFDQVIIPALNQGALVISDRSADSSLVYQGYGRGLDLELIQKVNQWAMQEYTPDITFYIHIDIKTARERILKRHLKHTAFEKETHVFWEKVIAGYQKIYSQRTNVITLDGTQSPEVLVQAALKALEKLL
jgi:dTMP kinase